MKKKLIIAASFFLFLNGFAQERISVQPLSPAFASTFESDDPVTEIQRLSFKKENLLIRLNELNKDAQNNAEEIYRVEGLIKYIDNKVERYEKYLLSVRYADSNGAPVKGSMTEEEYRAKKIAWQENYVVNPDAENQIKTTLTREEFERMPVERQERILLMPERYIILN